MSLYEKKKYFELKSYPYEIDKYFQRFLNKIIRSFYEKITYDEKIIESLKSYHLEILFYVKKKVTPRFRWDIYKGVPKARPTDSEVFWLI